MRRLLIGAIALGAAVLLIAWQAAPSPPQEATVLTFAQAHTQDSASPDPSALGSVWQPIRLPVSQPAAAGSPPSAAWFRMEFEAAATPQGFWAVLLPYLYGGGEVWLNGRLIGDIPVSTDAVHVRWERPHLVSIPAGVLQPGTNSLWVHAVPVEGETVLNVPRFRIGPLDDLRPLYDRRFFWVHTLPELTIGGCLVVSVLVLLIWWRLPEEVLYGWFGVATLLWGIRTLTFVMEVMPPDRWPWWRLLYVTSTGGFIVVMALFAARLAGLRQPWLERGLLLYWLAGPLWFVMAGLGNDAQVNRIWVAGLIPVGIAAVVVAFVSTWRQRTWSSAWLPLALLVATVSGVHDYLVVWHPQLFAGLAPGWAAERYFLLHHGANFLLLTMGGVLSARFVSSVRGLRELNETLESRVADRERALAANYARLAELEREHAAAQERRLIMREIHDGLGSKLFTTLSRVERGVMAAPDMAASLRACISDMRLALDALAPDDQDLLTALGDFMFRWQAELQAAGLRCEWAMDVPDEGLPLAPHTTLQILRIAQEALTNVVKHAQATRVDLLLQQTGTVVTLSIGDDGVGLPSPARAGGRGLDNMRARAEQLGGSLHISPRQDGGTCVVLTVPQAMAAASAAH
ncbi:Signal transduction histidine kinase [Roseateles sp. YR242]|uniref:sensor histidine kinase n=1 Tax=Roseateles sp. YR242 TaxID=1855305 RepID=UPI0008AC98ED|nr:sensor histidine kinase [Roseateles sp. YR242]SEK31056.1 Signal transduction histidine kinase [Roseateles sp. YR242]